MKTCYKLIWTVVLVLAVSIFYGCKKQEPVVSTGHEHQAVTEQAQPGEQTVCPVMGGAINKNVYTEYKGKKVYFCCPACKPEFEKDPEKYISKLPQFAK